MTTLEIIDIVLLIITYDLIKYGLRKLFNIGLYKGTRGKKGDEGRPGPMGPMGYEGRYPSCEHLKSLIKEVLKDD